MGVKGSSLFTHFFRLYVQCERKGANLVNNLPSLVTKDPNLQQLNDPAPIHPQHFCQLGNALYLVSPAPENGG